MYTEATPLGLGVRTNQGRFTIHDYQEYEEERHGVLPSPNGRAALLFGGIIW